MTTTPKYGLNKPEGSDYAKIQLLNENADKLDLVLGGLETGKEALINNAAGKATPIDADAVVITDSADSTKTKRITWANVIVAIKSALNSVYAAVGHTHAWNSITGTPSSFTPTAHASTHKTGGADALTAADVGAIPTTQKGAAGGVAALGSDGMVPLSQLPSQVKERQVVNTIAERNAISSKFSGLQVYVKDATADTTVKTGGADYLWDGSAWIKTGEAESMDVVLSWPNVQGKPTEFTPSSHTHAPSDLTTAVPISKGGTGATTAAAALIALGIATQAEAEAGTDNSKIMTPQRVKQAIAANKQRVLLMETVTASAAAQVDLDLSTLQLSKYKSILVVYSGAVSVANRAISITANNDTGSKYWSGSSGATTGTTAFGVTAGLSSDRGSFFMLELNDYPYGMAGRIAGGGGQSATGMSLKNESVFCSVCRLSALTKLSFIGSACEIVAGSKFEVYGIV